MTRKLASIRTIEAILPIEGADSIEVAKIGGWKVVTQKGIYKEGDVAIFCEIDSWIPHELAPFLSKGKEPREFNGVKGERLRTIKLRGQLSQGLLLSLLSLENLVLETREDGADVTELLGIQKWEMPVSAQLQGQAKGNFPFQIPKTDQERVQNLLAFNAGEGVYEVTIKLDGSSMTVANIDGKIEVCSRNLSLKLDQTGNTFVDVAKKSGLIESLVGHNNIAIQGELMGPGIQTNQERLDTHEFFVFDVYDIATRKYFTPEERYALCEQLNLQHVPILHTATTLRAINITTMQDCLNYAKGASLYATDREGVVFKNVGNGTDTWKAVSNSWLLKNE